MGFVNTIIYEYGALMVFVKTRRETGSTGLALMNGKLLRLCKQYDSQNVIKAVNELMIYLLENHETVTDTEFVEIVKFECMLAQS